MTVFFILFFILRLSYNNMSTEGIMSINKFDVLELEYLR